MSTPDLRRTILDASVALVAEQGVRAVSFREVARRAGVSHQAPYHHFGNHHGILEAIAREGFSELTAAMRSAALAEPHDALAALVASGVAYVRFALSHVGHFRVMFHSRVAPAGADPCPLEEAEATYQALSELCSRAHSEGHGRTLDPDAMAHLCWSVVHGLSTLMIEGALDPKVAVPAMDEESLTRQVVHSLGHLLRAAPDTPGARPPGSPRKAPRRPRKPAT
ncbi:MAG: TetR/AcrR family transcriptional regulator [Polyangiaceae bacterium]